MDLLYSGDIHSLAYDSDTDLDSECAYGVSQTPGTSENGRACSDVTESSTWGWQNWGGVGGGSARIDPNQPINAWLFVLILNVVGFKRIV